MTTSNNHHIGPRPLELWGAPAPPAESRADDTGPLHTVSAAAPAAPAETQPHDAAADPTRHDDPDRPDPRPWVIHTAAASPASASPAPATVASTSPVPPTHVAQPTTVTRPTGPAAAPPPFASRGHVDDGAPRPTGTAADLSHNLLVRPRRERPTMGWRSAVYTLTGGLVNLGLSPAEAERLQQIARIQAPLAGTRTITVASMKGGVGKTTVSALLGLTLAEYRGDRVLALDANPDAGTLADRLVEHPVHYTVRDLINDLGRVQTLTDISMYTSLAGRLQVLASEQDPRRSESFNKSEYEAVLDVLRRFYNVIITDSGTGLVHSAMHGALNQTLSLVIVGAPTVDGSSRAGKTLDWLKSNGYGGLVSDAVVALSYDRYSRDVNTAKIREHFAGQCRAVVELPADPHLSSGGHIRLDALRPATRAAALALSAHVADRFGDNTRAQAWAPPPPGAEPWAGAHR